MTDNPSEISPVKGRRALLTERERDVIAGIEGDDRLRAQKAAKVRRRTLDNLAADVAVLAHHHPELLAEIRAILCDEADQE
ncbi:hypothetical protein [Natrinema sp. H-ect4]|uniref:hypothetical protein n=1 Tax=Natrinema sp. H-ect4 TaxID=3242699 RepID=UPI0035A94E05